MRWSAFSTTSIPSDEGWRSAMRLSPGEERIAGKYSLAQKAIHHAFTIVVLTAIGTGLMMLVKIDTPWCERDPYWLGEYVWGVIYVLHDLAALFLIRTGDGVEQGAFAMDRMTSKEPPGCPGIRYHP